MWKFLVKSQSIEVLEREVLADHQIQYVQFKFTFDGDWRRFHKVVQFTQCDETYNIVLGTDGTSLYLPAELHVGRCKNVGVRLRHGERHDRSCNDCAGYAEYPSFRLCG